MRDYWPPRLLPTLSGNASTRSYDIRQKIKHIDDNNARIENTVSLE